MQDLFKHLPAVIYEYAITPEGDTRFNFISDTATTILGLQPEALRVDHSLLFSIVHKADLPSLKMSVYQSLERNGTSQWKGRIHVGGALKWVQLRSNDELTNEGVILRRGVIQEINSGNATHPEELQEYQGLLENFPIGVVIHSHGKIIFANPHAHFIIGARKPGELIGLKTMDFVHPDYIEGITQRINRVSEGDSVPMVEEKFIRFDGKIIDVETMGSPFVFKGEAAIQVIFRDITEKKNTEAQFRKNETLFSQFFQNVPMAVVMLDDTGKILQVNMGFERMFGYEENELRGKNLNDFIVPDELRNEGINLSHLTASKNQVVSIESIRKHRSGKMVNVILCGVPVMLDNQTIGIYGIYIDISDRKKVEEELKIRNAELDNFVYKVSHDLRAPLSSVLGLVNLSKLQGNSDNPLEYIRIIGEKIEALDHFIGDVLSHSKNLKVEVNLSKVDCRKIIEQTFTDLGYLSGVQEMKLSIKIEGIDFYSDHWRISEIFRNLISNSIKYRQSDSEQSEISIQIKIDHLSADINFSDNGIGIQEVNLKRIFEMFYRATDQSDGSGIGLYIVKNAVEKLGGQINVASKPGIGTRFHILLPNRINSIINHPL